MYTAYDLNARLPYAFDGELEWLTTRAKSLTGESHVVMLGAGPGVMALALFEGAPEPFPFIIVDKVSYDTARVHLMVAGHDLSKTTFVLSDSTDYGLAYQGPRLDFLIIDADHSYKAVFADIVAWFPHVRDGAHIFFHDVVDREQNGTNGVRQAITRVLELGYTMALVAQVGTTEVYEVRWNR